MTWSELNDLAVERIECPYCHAAPRSRCVVVKGRTAGTRATWTHAARTDLVWRGWTIGYTEGGRDALDEIARALETRLSGASIILAGAIGPIPVDTLIAQVFTRPRRGWSKA